MFRKKEKDYFSGRLTSDMMVHYSTKGHEKDYIDTIDSDLKGKFYGMLDDIADEIHGHIKKNPGESINFVFNVGQEEYIEVIRDRIEIKKAQYSSAKRGKSKRRYIALSRLNVDRIGCDGIHEPVRDNTLSPDRDGVTDGSPETESVRKRKVE